MTPDGLFIWVAGLRGPACEWWSDEYAFGLHERSIAMPLVLSRHKLKPGESILPLDELVKRYPAPPEKPVTKFKLERGA